MFCAVIVMCMTIISDDPLPFYGSYLSLDVASGHGGLLVMTACTH